MMTSSDSAGAAWFVSIKYSHCWLPQLSAGVDDNIYDSSLNIVSSTSYSLISDGRSETGRDGS